MVPLAGSEAAFCLRISWVTPADSRPPEPELTPAADCHALEKSGFDAGAGGKLGDGEDQECYFHLRLNWLFEGRINLRGNR